MNTKSTDGLPNYRNFDNEADKPFYAAYLNTAVQNVYIILKDISGKLEQDFSGDDNQMFTCKLLEELKDNHRPELTQKTIEKLNRHFSFLNYLARNHAYNRSSDKAAEPTHEDYHEILISWGRLLLDYRNFYSHAEHTPVLKNSFVLDGMYVLYDADWQKFRERKTLEVNETEHLIRLGENGEKPSFHYSFTNETGELSQNGFLFFLCLWLGKKDSQELLKKHKGFKRGESKSQKATLEKFTWFGISIPQPRLSSDNSIQALFMDIANELKRCPAELFSLLDEKDRQNFKALEVQEDDVTGEYQGSGELKRRHNRFYYFALRYLDTRFKHLKFHIDLGNYCYKSYEQEIEEEARKRRWIRRMTAFGNLTDFNEENCPQEWKDRLQKKDDTVKNDTYIIETTPHYHFDAGSDVKTIGMKWIKTYDKNNVWPTILPVDETGTEPKPRNEPPDYWLSLYELPAMAFYQLLYETGMAGYTAEEVIHNYTQKVNAFLAEIQSGRISAELTREALIDVLDKRGLYIQNLPKAVIGYLLARPAKSLEKRARERLERMIAENNQMLDRVKRQKKHYQTRPGSKDYVAMKSGHMADFLARDMICLQKPVLQEKGKANSTEFQVLQAKLALFGKNKETLADTFRLCNLIGSSNPHPFLSKIDGRRCNGLLDFYTCYLEHREGWFKQCLHEKKYSDYHFLKLRNEHPDISALLKRQREAVMNLPRGLFRESIYEALKKSERTGEWATELGKKDRVNTAYIINEYFRQIRQDDSQEFYGYKRSYDLLNRLYDERKPKDRNPVSPVWYTVRELEAKSMEIKQKLEEKIQKKVRTKPQNEARIIHNYRKQYREFVENEKQIRLYQVCDKVLFMMLDHLYQKGDFLFDEKEKHTLEVSEQYKLREIKPHAEKSLLSEQVTAKLGFHYSEKSENKKALPLEYYKTIIREHVQVKNYGDFRRFLKDRRIPGLLPYISVDEICYEALQRELEEYSISRGEFLDAMIKFEKTVIQKYGIRRESTKAYIDHRTILNCVQGLSEEKKKQMNKFRNAFCHGQYPDPGFFREMVNGNDFNRLKEYRSGAQEVRNCSVIVQLKNRALTYYNEAIDMMNFNP